MGRPVRGLARYPRDSAVMRGQLEPGCDGSGVDRADAVNLMPRLRRLLSVFWVACALCLYGSSLVIRCWEERVNNNIVIHKDLS